MKKIIQYFLIGEESPEELSREVNKSGTDWQPFGSPFWVVGDGMVNNKFYQAVVKYDDGDGDFDTTNFGEEREKVEFKVVDSGLYDDSELESDPNAGPYRDDD